MELLDNPQPAVAAMVGIVAGLGLLWRGFGARLTATRIADTGTSSIASMAAGEVRLSGAIEPAEVTLVSLLQSTTCVYYHSRIDTASDSAADGDLDEERAVGFVLRDGTGSVRIFPRGARWDAPLAFEDRQGGYGDGPAGLSLRTGSAVGPAELDRETAIARLLAVRAPAITRPTGARGRVHYREWRLEPGDIITVVGRAMPFAMLNDPSEADVDAPAAVGADDPEVLASIAEARAAGTLLDDPQAAWGNAGIPGFGIGSPVRAPALDPDAAVPALAVAADAERFERRFHIAPEALVLASGPGAPLFVAHGAPDAAAGRQQDRFIVGLLGAVLSIASAVVLAISLTGGLGR